MVSSATFDPVRAAARAALSTGEDPELGLDFVSLGLAFGPLWSSERVSDDARFLLGTYG